MFMHWVQFLFDCLFAADVSGEYAPIQPNPKAERKYDRACPNIPALPRWEIFVASDFLSQAVKENPNGTELIGL